MRRRRKFEISLKVLDFCVQPVGITRLIDGLRLTYSYAKNVCSELVELGLLKTNIVVKKCRQRPRSLSPNPRTYKRTYYEITPKGIELLKRTLGTYAVGIPVTESGNRA